MKERCGSSPNKRRESGLTLLETVISIVIGLVILAGIGVLVYKAMSTNKTSRAYTEITTIMQNMRNLYSGTTPNSALSTSMTTYIDAGVIPKNMIQGSAVYNPWGGTVGIGSPPTGSSTYTGLSVRFDTLPRQACIEYTTKLNTLTGGGTYIAVDSTGWWQHETLAYIDSVCTSSTNNNVWLGFMVRG